MVPGPLPLPEQKYCHIFPFISLETRFIEITLNIENFPTENNSFDIIHFGQVLLCRRLFGVHLQFILPVSLENQYCSMVAIISHVPCTFLKDWHILISRQNPKTLFWTKRKMAWFDYIMPTSTRNLDRFMGPFMGVTNVFPGEQVKVSGCILSGSCVGSLNHWTKPQNPFTKIKIT